MSNGDEEAIALLNAGSPELIQILKERFAARPELILDFLLGTACFLAHGSGLSLGDLAKAIGEHWLHAEKVYAQAVAWSAQNQKE